MRAWVGLVLGVAALAVPLPAMADTTVFLGAGIPVYPVHRHRHYPPPVVVYGAPPPVVVYQPPPPAVVYAPMAGAGLSATPASPPYTRNGQTCREYQTTVTVDGTPQRAFGTACQQADGSWRTVN
ncbi:hypothetical protein [Azospirillum sp. TSO22-1]|uniref:hypothetical protein n=1 Tax=Azospirillum sp. TSO22-1 TaxID=716789 RepID=UPI000D6176AC|nr:hypothetical protein [Azospirillum sp. TSO22-1]PWC44746.1 hypothetical protein TSO221_17660 [Azospirillum sp. TSO22-1]